MEYRRENLSFTAPDFTINSPFIVDAGVRRIVRLRNPHQMVMCILENGQIAMFHYEPTIQMAGWSRAAAGAGTYIDATVLIGAGGIDTPIFLVRRNINGVKRLYIESVPGWTAGETWQYLDAWKAYDNTTGTNVFGGLDYLEARTVDVIGDDAYIGAFPVVNGEVTLVDGEGMPITPSVVAIGLPKWCYLKTFPPVVDETTTGGPGAFKRFSSISLRLRNSRPPIINGIRPPDKSSNTTMDQGEPLVPLQDVDVANFGFSLYEPIEIGETLPLRSEIVGIYGKLSSNRL
jgi:hypothetical protein